MDDQEAYLNSLMETMSLTGNSRVNNGEPNQNETRNEGRVVSIGEGRGYNNIEAPTLNNMRMRMLMTYYNPYLSGTSTVTGGSSTNCLPPSLDCINRPGFVLSKFVANPYDVMTSSTTYHDFKNMLKNCYSKADQRRILLTLIERPNDLFAIACHDHGSVVIKELIQLLKKEDCISELTKILAPSLSYLMNHQYGRHVVEQCFKHLNIFKTQPLHEALQKQLLLIANSKYGCISLQICMDSMDSSPASKSSLLIAIAANAANLALHEYGIFVLQHVVPMNNINDAVIVYKLRHLYFELCTSKSGSYLVEKYIATGFRSYIAVQLLETDNLVPIALNEFGNYIIQKLLKETKRYEASLYVRLCNILLTELSTLECNPYSRKVANMLKAYCKYEAYRTSP